MPLTAFADCEYGTLKEALVCSANKVDAADAVSGEEVWTNHDLATVQHERLVDAMRREGIVCHSINPSFGIPYQCFMRDSSVSTPWGLIVSRMGSDQRKKETGILAQFAKDREIGIWKNVLDGALEGGDVHLLRPGHAVIGCSGWRTSDAAARQASQWFKDQGWQCRIFSYPRAFIHLDIVFGVLDHRNIICCPEALQRSDIDWLASIGFNIHRVRLQEADNMICNALCLGERRLLSCSQNQAGNALLRELGFHVIEVDLSQFVRAGGGTRCLVQALRRERYAVS
jgi:arginine deiminase